ncbi:hypothetical protein H9W84_07545 [Moraxella sp. PS-22]|uniref:Big-1 domain-containing protein n=1 Tax=Moraxella tetraodonis TaxID=2767221 RepID=A0A9X1US09_9GAMM|nr:hypothetical protein [Moraxella tetraodonis]MCG8147982.1 hypothetical protein [Moraxella tetraodonis]
MAISTNLIKSFQLSALTTALALAGCGGGGGNDTLPPPVKTGTVSVTNPSTGTDSTTTTNLASVKKVQLVSTSSDFYMNVGDSVELTVYALNSNNIGVASVPVSVQITDPSVTGVFSGISPNLVTDDTGKAVIKLDIKSLTNDQKNYLKQNGLVVTTTVGTVSTSKTLKGTDVNTTTPTPTVTVSNLLLISDSQNITLVKGTKINVTALAVDKDNNIIPNTTIDFNIGNSVLSGIFANSNLSVLTNDRGEAILELELKSLSAEQISYLLNTGLTINSTARTGSVASNTINLKGVEQGSTTTKLDVQKVNLTTPKPNFNVQVGEKFTVTASVLNSSNTGLGGVPVQFKLDDPSTTGVYAVSDTSNVVTNASGEATIELEVKSEAAKAKLLSQGINITATAKNTTGTTPVDVTNKLNILGKDPAFNENITKVSKVGLSSSLTNNEFDLTVGNTFTVTANVLDASQGALANVPVTFTLPGLDQTGIANLSGSTVTTDAQGKATINLSLTSLNATQRSYLMSNGLTVNASVANGTSVAPIKLSAKQSSTLPVTVESVSVVADSDNILMTAGSTVKVTAIALDKNFGGLANQTLTVKIPDPSATGVYNITGSTITTDSKGEAIFNLQIKSALTAAQKQALANGLVVDITAANGKTSQIKLSAKAVNDVVVSNVNLTSNVTNIPLSVGSQFTVTANVSDAQNGTIANSPVTFSLPSLADYGVTSLSPSTIITDDKGQAIITLQVQSLTDTQRANLLKGFTINATANGKVAPALTLTGMDTIKRFDVKAVNLSSPISKFNIKTGERFTVTASVLGANNTGIGGAPVEFTIDNPSLTGVYAVSDTTNVITNVNGEATIELEVKSEAAKQLLLTDGVTITAIAKNTLNNPPADISGKKTILGTDPTLSANIAKVSKALLVSSVNPFDLTVGNKLSITASIADANNGKLDGVPVSFTLPDLDKTGIANLSGSTIVTNANGEAIINLEIKSLSADQRNYILTNGLTVKAAVPNGTVISPLQLSAKNVTTPDNTIDSISVTADSNNIIMAAGSRVRVTAVALDKNFGGIKGQNLTVNIPNPALTGVFNLSGSTVTTNDKGEAIIDLEVKTTLTDAQKAALLNGLNVTVAAQNGRQGVINLAAKAANEVSVSTVNLTGSNIPLTIGSQVKVVATVLDDQKGVVKNTPVTFTLPSFADTGVASLSASTVLTDDKGEAVITLEVKSLTDAQKQALLNGFTINATSNGKAAPALILKGVDTSVKRLDVKSVKLTSPVNPFNIKIGERFTVTASVLNGNNTGIGGAPVEFNLLTNPSVSGVYAVSDTSNITTNASGEATIELEVKSTAAKDYLIQNGISIQAVSKNTMNTTPVDVKGNITLKGIDPSAVPVEANIALVKQGALSSSLSNNIFDLTVGTTFDITASVADANQGPLSKVPVTFSLPGLESTGIANLSGSTVTTDTQGKAVIKLRIDSLSKTQRNYLLTNGLVVNATVPNGTKINPIKLTARDAGIDSVITSIAVTADRDDILMMAGSKVHVTASALNGNFGGVAASDLTFSIPDPALTNVFNITGTTVKTDEKGEASIDLEVKNLLTASQKAYLQNGLKVKVTAPSGAVGEITLKAKAVNEVSIDKVVLENFPNTPVVLSQGNEFIVMAHTVDAQNGAVTNAPVTFNLPDPTTTGIVSLSPSTVLTSEVAAPVEPMIGERAVIIPKGTAYIRLRVIDPAKAEKLIASGYMVKAVSNGNVTQTLNVPLTKTAAQPTVNDIAKVNLVTDVNTLTTNNGDTINVTAQVRDAKNFSLANMPVSFTLLDAAAATGIINTTPLQTTTNANGEAVLTLKVGALTPDQKYYLQTSGLSFKATAGAITSSTVTLRTQEAITANSVNTLLLTSDSAIQLAIGSKVKVTALAVDKNGAVVPNAQVSFKVPTDSGLVNNTGAVVNTNANGEATIEVEIKDLAKATTALQNGLVVTAQSGVSVGTTTIVSASSQSATQAYNVFVSKSKDELRTGNDSLSMTIRVTDINGGIKANVPVYLQILEDGIARGLSFNKVSTLKTDDKGLVTVDLSQNDIGLVSRLNGTGKISVIVNDGVYRAEKEEVTIPITGTTIDNLFVSNKEISATTNSTISATALDGSGKPFANTKVELLLSDKSLATPKFYTTDAQGKFTFTVSQAELGGQATKYPLSVKLFGTNSQGVEISSSPIALTELKVVSQTETKLEVSANNVLMANNEIMVNTTGQITILRPKDKNGFAIPNYVPDSDPNKDAENRKRATVYLSTNKGTLNGQGTRVEGLVQQRTNNEGVLENYVNFTISSPVANTANLVLEYNGEQVFTDSISFLTADVKKLLLQIERTTLSTNGETNVIATVKDSNDLPVKNAIVEFSLVQDASGGRLEKGYAITDDSGNAIVKYYSGRTPTANDAVQIRTTVNSIQVNGNAQTVTPLTSEIKTLTVQTNATFIGFGFADKIRQHPDGRNIYYVYDGSIFVNNNISQPAANQPVSVSIIPVQYLLGEYYVIPKIPAVPEVKDDPNTAQDESSPAVPEVPAKWGIRHYDSWGVTTPGAVMCLNEDANNNGILDALEDANKNGKLDPINPATILSASGTELVNGQTMMTDATGKLDFSIRYTKESAGWWIGMIKVTTKVNGTEFVEYRTITLPTAEEDVSEPDATPPLRPNWISPFGLRTQFNGYKYINNNPYCY